MGIIGEAAEAAGAVAKVVKDNPHGMKAVDYTAQVAEIVTHTVRNLLLPFAAINFGIDCARRYFEDRFGEELQEKLANVPPGLLVAPRPSIAGPVVQGLAYSFEEAELRNMYLNLLASAMDGRVADDVHPAFVEIIKQLSPFEARALQNFGSAERGLFSQTAIVNMNTKAAEESATTYKTVLRHIVDPKKYLPDVSETPERETAAIDNWNRLGLFSVDYTAAMSDENVYAFTEELPYINGFRELGSLKGFKVEFTRGVLDSTAFGRAFFEAVIIDRGTSSASEERAQS